MSAEALMMARASQGMAPTTGVSAFSPGRAARYNYVTYSTDGSTVSRYEDLRDHHTYQTTRDGLEARDFTFVEPKSDSDVVDIPSPIDGVVEFAGEADGYGNLVEVKGDDGSIVRIGHKSSIAVTPGQRVRRGESLGKQGSTGRSTGPHVHIEAPAHVMKDYVNTMTVGGGDFGFIGDREMATNLGLGGAVSEGVRRMSDQDWANAQAMARHESDLSFRENQAQRNLNISGSMLDTYLGLRNDHKEALASTFMPIRRLRS